jgi:hypothetical protein
MYKLFEDGLNEAETCSSDIRLCVRECVCEFVGVSNEQFNFPY